MDRIPEVVEEFEASKLGIGLRPQIFAETGIADSIISYNRGKGFADPGIFEIKNFPPPRCHCHHQSISFILINQLL